MLIPGQTSPQATEYNKLQGTKSDRVPDELWTEVCDTVQETGIKTISMEKKCKKAKWLSGEALQIAVKRTEVKNKHTKKLNIFNLTDIKKTWQNTQKNCTKKIFMTQIITMV